MRNQKNCRKKVKGAHDDHQSVNIGMIHKYLIKLSLNMD